MTMLSDVKPAVIQADALAAADRAGRLVAPLWPLSSFVAVNPFLGFADRPFEAAMTDVARLSGARMTLAATEYVAAIDAGRITAEDLEAAAALHPGVARDGRALDAAARNAGEHRADPLPTLADLANATDGEAWPQRVAAHVADVASRHFDAGQGAWSTARADGSLWAAWRADAAHDLSLAAMGLPQARARIAGLPETTGATLEFLAGALELSGPALETWFARLLYTVQGWAGHARYRLWQAELAGTTDDALTDLLAIRAVCDWLCRDLVPADAWEGAKRDYAATAAPQKDAALLAALQTAYENGWRTQAFAAIGTEAPASGARPPVQAAFCIDVRSEVFRRAFETAMPGAETLGFAGFFGAAVSYLPLGAAAETARCPVLLSSSGCAREEGSEALAETRAERIAATSIWARFKQAAVSSFGYVETMGLAYAPRLAAQSLKASTALSPRHPGLTRDEAAGLAPSLDVIPEAARVGTAATILKAMSLTGPFARLVVLAGHGGTSLNNPHNAGLDCGACGGHDGEVNARLVARLLNDPEVRAGLPEHGIEVPSDTVFVPALHDTTTDGVTLFDTKPFLETHAGDLAALKRGFAAAGRIARAERAALLNLDPEARVDEAVQSRARDWAQTRPEWALAGCAAFIAAPRHRTRGVDLGGRAFLHSYGWEADAKNGYPVLELILTAPLVVASWINLQYYGSTVDNAVFGAGNKVLHNVSGLTGVIEGSSGDLRPGLPMQSVHDGERFIHEPMRLTAMVEAPAAAMSDIISRHEGLAALLDNGWVGLFRMDETGKVAERYVPGGGWAPVGPEVEARVARVA
ncbi:DUF2309 domain-containing protein [Roseibacterium sp. SDUM158017]|uniref:YbcC family protein n=1 Tax=Roseicyclus salinarum TaxID=3036773 RepID=UPI00241563A8|nr:DUF2309 domain-containing protein [Roseibacterium sp. SDUM158017]MDG4648533.1 DUF2309 domain-containing protein [Roseibacterium sp. SDUM158017]